MTRPIDIGVSLLSRAEPAGFQRAQWAERNGFDSVWIPDGDGKMHALTLAGAVAATTQRVRIGTGIVPVYTHTPAVLASSCTALGHLAPGRFVIGVGASSQAMMEKWNGLPFDKPLTRVRETVQVLRRMLAGERVEFEGETLRTSGFRLNPPPPQPVPIYLAALRPKMLELAGELGDGVILNLVPLRVLPRMLEHVATGARRAGRSLADLDVTVRFNVAVGDERAAALEDVRFFIQRYFTAPVYRKYFEWCGYEDAVRTFVEAFARGDREASAAALTDELVAEMSLAGTEADVQAQLRGFLAAGVSTVILNPLVPTLEATDRTFAAFAPKHFRATG
jgi:probable F420-dependent oxidoreductase